MIEDLSTHCYSRSPLSIDRRKIVKLEQEVEQLHKVTAMHRRILDMLVKDMLLLQPKRMVCDNTLVLEDDVFTHTTEKVDGT